MTPLMAVEEVIGGGATDILGIGGAAAIVAAAVGWVWRIEKDLIARLRVRNKELEEERESVAGERDQLKEERDRWRFRYHVLAAKTGAQVPMPKLGDEDHDDGPTPPAAGPIQ